MQINNPLQMRIILLSLGLRAQVIQKDRDIAPSQSEKLSIDHELIEIDQLKDSLKFELERIESRDSHK